jgi:hypothetical protein
MSTPPLADDARRLAEQVVQFVKSYRDNQPTDMLWQAVDSTLLHELLAAAHACDPIRRSEEQLAREGGDPPEIVLRRAEVAGWRHLVHEASKRLHRAEDELAKAQKLRFVP